MLIRVSAHHLDLVSCMLQVTVSGHQFTQKSVNIIYLAETPIRAKKQVVEKYLEGKRLREEKVLLEKEMTGFLKFYKDTVIPGLSTSIDRLTAVLNGRGHINVVM